MAFFSDILALMTEGQSVTPTGSTSPDAPAIGTLTAGDGQVTVPLTPASGEDATPMYILYWTPGGSISAESETWKRTGAGSVTVTGLTNNQTYGFVAYHKSGDVVGYVPAPKYAAPDDGSNPVTGALNSVIDTTRDMIANSSTWQTWTGTGNAVDAKAETYNGGVDIPAGETAAEYLRDSRPCAIVWIEDDWQADRIATECTVYSGRVHVQLIANLPSDYTEDDDTEMDVAPSDTTIQASEIWLKRQIAAVAADIMDLSGSAGYLLLQGYQFESDPMLVEGGLIEPDAGDPYHDWYVEVEMSFEFGADS